MGLKILNILFTFIAIMFGSVDDDESESTGPFYDYNSGENHAYKRTSARYYEDDL